MAQDDYDERRASINRMKRLSGELSSLTQSLLQYRTNQFATSAAPSPPRSRLRQPSYFSTRTLSGNETTMPVLAEKDLNTLTVRDEQPLSEKVAPAYGTRATTTPENKKKPIDLKLQVQDLKLDEDLAYQAAVKTDDDGTAEHSERKPSADDDEGADSDPDRTIVVTRKPNPQSPERHIDLNAATRAGELYNSACEEKQHEGTQHGAKDDGIEKKLAEAMEERDAFCTALCSWGVTSSK